MELVSLLKTEWYKQKRGLLWLFLLIIPSGTTLAMYLDMKIRFTDYLLFRAKEEGINSWEMLLMENHHVLGWGVFLPLFVGIIYTLIYQMEISQNSWKQYLSLPIKKENAFLSKFLMGFFFSFLLIALNTAGLVVVGKIIGFPEAIDWRIYGEYIFYQTIVIMGVAAIQNWLSSYLLNPILPVFIAFMGLIISVILSSQLAKYFPYSLVNLMDSVKGQFNLQVVLTSLLFAILGLVLGAWHFKKKDIL